MAGSCARILRRMMMHAAMHGTAQLRRQAKAWRGIQKPESPGAAVNHGWLARVRAFYACG